MTNDQSKRLTLGINAKQFNSVVILLILLLLVIFLASIQTWRHLRHLQIIITSTKLHKIPFVAIKSNLTYVCSFVFTSVSSMALTLLALRIIRE